MKDCIILFLNSICGYNTSPLIMDFIKIIVFRYTVNNDGNDTSKENLGSGNTPICNKIYIRCQELNEM